MISSNLASSYSRVSTTITNCWKVYIEIPSRLQTHCPSELKENRISLVRWQHTPITHTQEAEAKESQKQGQPEMHSETISKNNNTKKSEIGVQAISMNSRPVSAT